MSEDRKPSEHPSQDAEQESILARAGRSSRVLLDAVFEAVQGKPKDTAAPPRPTRSRTRYN